MTMQTLQHGFYTIVYTSENIQGQSTNCNTDHALGMVKELDGLGIQGEVAQMLQNMTHTFSQKISTAHTSL